MNLYTRLFEEKTNSGRGVVIEEALKDKTILSLFDHLGSVYMAAAEETALQVGFDPTKIDELRPAIIYYHQ